MRQICPECNCSVGNNLILDKNRERYFCPSCYFRWNPPVLVLVRPWYFDHYIFPITGDSIYREVDDFKRCGFNLFNHKIFRSINTNPKAREVLTFHYRGRLKCNLLAKYYTHWHPMMPTCQQKFCHI
jgi:hypothetical protein